MCVPAHGVVPMTDEGSSVTLIFYRINPKWWTEPALNLASAVAQMSNLTHCEISIGEDAGINGTMKHVARVFNDSVRRGPTPVAARARVCLLYTSPSPRD